ncbi:hypothetical protein [Brucella tritici]|uniref:hypothetical protein n=1 Tax=Brucella tritici TaxID=94626 RepID=UPI0020009FE4|nr:hypothetical protein [Brucella tritici]
MAIRPDYVTGTISLVSGSVNFTTSGSALQVASVQAGDEIITPSGDILIIATITGQNSGTLFLPCPASAAGTGLALRIRFQPDGSRYQGAARDLIEKLASGNVEALAGITGTANTMPYFTGAGTMDRTPLTAFARSLLDDTTADAMRSTLGLTDTSIQSSALNSYGNYAPAGGVNINNLNAGDAGLYNTANTGAPSIPSVSWWWVETQRLYSTSAVRQIATAYATSGTPLPYVMVRMRSADGTWSEWSGHSSQWFSNANGFCNRDTSGFQFCYFNTSTDANGDVTWVYPAAFVWASPNAWATPVGSTGNGISAHTVSRNLTSATFRLRYTSTNAPVTTAIYIQAIGRWF